MPLAQFTQGTSFLWKVPFSNRSRYGNFSAWKRPEHNLLSDMPVGGWPIVCAGHGGNGSNQGDLEWSTNGFLLEMINNHKCIVISYDYNSASFYKKTAHDPRGTVFPETLLEHIELWAFLARNYRESSLWGAGVQLTRDSKKKMAYGLSHTGWVQPLIAMIPHIELPGGFRPLGREKMNLYADDWRFDFFLANQGHMMMSDFWMTKPIAPITPPAQAVPVVAGGHTVGDTTIAVTGSLTGWDAGRMITFSNAPTFEYLVTAAGSGVITIWPGLDSSLAGGESVDPFDLGLSKYAEGNYSWAGAPTYDPYEENDWQTYDIDKKRQMDLLTYLEADNPRVYESVPVLMYPASGAPFISNDSDSDSGALNVFTQSGPNIRYQTLHAEGCAYAAAQRLVQLGRVQGTDFLMRAGGSRTNPDATTRYSGAAQAVIDLGAFMTAKGWTN